MIKSVVLKNFRGFKDHTIDFMPFCLLIGQNNAGKTTLIEALRIASSALKKAPTANFYMAPDHLLPEIAGPIFRFSIETLDIEHRGMHYNYGSREPAIIRIRYNNHCSLVISIGESSDDICCQLILSAGRKVNSRSQFSTSKFRSVFVMPPVGALLAEETQRNKTYLKKHMNGYLSYRHIRNQMADMPKEFAKFKDLLVNTWSSSLKIGDIEYGLGVNKNNYGLTIRDGPFVSEMALVGSGLQAWIQTIWFLSRVDPDAIVILDEPDVYLHADLQRKLIKLLSAESYRQTIVATHSMEMIADVSPSEIISVTKRESRSRPLSSSTQAQGVVDAIGTNHNIQLSKLASAGRILFVEGKDHTLIDQIAFKLGNAFYDRFSKIPHFSVGGMNNWPRAAMAAKAFHDTSAGKVAGVMFLDRDYKPDNLFETIIIEAAKDSLFVRVWSKKEIENFLLNVELIHSYIENRAKESVRIEDARDIFDLVMSEMAESLPELIADGYQTADRKLALTTAMARSKDLIKKRTETGYNIQDMICGKKAISMISAKTQERWSVQISPMSLCRHMKLDDVPAEILMSIKDLVDPS
ncbi:ATP-binding protein [Sphingomonas sp. PP-CE-1G-424]|uniref:ATP-dependent nuclease n=1 Tax=Sphingomonas sp. PP-CE-1G-424 TaxID=2135658 RepID=UPI001055B6BD|nr:ATP-binding protein [Sphingomonas sp. PP-CE-1G-424]TCP72632.1 putative ATP-dependent endonuclease of OLD family [Sphingomonas sp. PP-CE-1G-424]